MTTEPKHTPTPWISKAEMRFNGVVDYYIGTPDGQTAVACVSAWDGTPEPLVVEANADLIIQAVNSHESLTGLVGELVEALQNFMNGVSTNAITSEQDETFAYAITKAQAILTKAKALQSAAGK